MRATVRVTLYAALPVTAAVRTLSAIAVPVASLCALYKCSNRMLCRGRHFWCCARSAGDWPRDPAARCEYFAFREDGARGYVVNAKARAQSHVSSGRGSGSGRAGGSRGRGSGGGGGGGGRSGRGRG